MSDTPTLNIQERSASEQGTRACVRLRKAGRIPAVVYGGGADSVSVSVDRAEIDRLIRRKETHGMLSLSGRGKPLSAIIKDVQWDTWGDHLLHIDFNRVTAGEVVEVEIPIEIRGTAPGVVAGGILDQPLHSMPITSPVESIPEMIPVSVNALEIGDEIHVKDLDLPPKCSTRLDPDQMVLHITQPKAEEEEETAELPAEPEVIGKSKEEEGGNE